MVDNRSKQSRSALMSRIRSKNTAPEITVRRLLHGLGYRFRLHRSDLPGSPDIVFPSRQAAIFVNGCFWHAHGCKIGKPPNSKLEFWQAKLERNRKRDAENEAGLRTEGWRVLTVWQCQIRDRTKLEALLVGFLGQPGRKNPIHMPPTDR